jgi:predicted transposase YbfD/YdcC
MEELKERLSLIPDPRHSGYVGHKLSDILIITMAAVMCGIDQLCDLVVFANEKSAFFAEYFNITQIPSKSTFSRVLKIVRAESVVKIIVEIMKERAGELGKIIAVDGKAIRSTSEKGKPHSALQILTAYMVENGIVLGQESIHEKTNEIPVLRDMLDYIDVRDKIVTADAMHCQRETCAKITDEGHEGDYVFGVKENQQNLCDDIKLFLSDKINEDEIETHIETEKNGGRTERRICKKAADISWLSEHERPGLAAVFSVRRIVTAQGITTDETGYYISSKDAAAKELLEISRAHWNIESMHWMLDVDFSEDECELKSENGQKTLNIFRKLALFAHRQYMKTQAKNRSIKSNILRCLISE